MAEHRVTRKDMRQPDAFQTWAERAADQIAPHIRKILIVVTVILAAGLIGWTVNANKEQKIQALNAKFSDIASAYEQAFQLSIAGEDADWASVQADLEAMLDETGGTPLYPIVLQYIANTYIAMGRYDAALGPLEDLERMVQEDPQKLVLALYTRGKALELSGDRQGAIKAYNEAASVVPNPLGEFLEQEAKRASGPVVSPEILKKYTAAAETDENAQ